MDTQPRVAGDTGGLCMGSHAGGWNLRDGFQGRVRKDFLEEARGAGERPGSGAHRVGCDLERIRSGGRGAWRRPAWGPSVPSLRSFKQVEDNSWRRSPVHRVEVRLLGGRHGQATRCRVRGADRRCDGLLGLLAFDRALRRCSPRPRGGATGWARGPLVQVPGAMLLPPALTPRSLPGAIHTRGVCELQATVPGDSHGLDAGAKPRQEKALRGGDVRRGAGGVTGIRTRRDRTARYIGACRAAALTREPAGKAGQPRPAVSMFAVSPPAGPCLASGEPEPGTLEGAPW